MLINRINKAFQNIGYFKHSQEIIAYKGYVNQDVATSISAHQSPNRSLWMTLTYL